MERPSNRVELTATAPGSTPQGAKMRERLSDPAQREQVRVESREHLRSMYPELAQELGIDAALEAKIIEVFTDQQMVHLERFWGEHSDTTFDDVQDSMRQQTDAENQTKRLIRDLLGQEAYGRYLDYKDTLFERQQVVYYEKRLGAGDKLLPDQKQRLMQVLRAQHEADIERRRGGSQHLFESPLRDISPQAMQRRNVELNEEGFRQMQRDSQALLQLLPAILTPTQLGAYGELEKTKLAGQRKWVQELRVSAGMSPEFDETKSPPTPTRRTPVTGKVKLELYLTVDEAPPANVTIVTENGKPASGFQASQALWAVPTPTLYEDGWVQLNIDFFEARGGRRRRLPGGVNMGMLQRLPDNRPLAYGGGRSTLDGSRTFAITTNVRVTRAE